MLLIPKKTKYKKVHKSRIRGVSNTNLNLSFGSYGLRVLSCGRISNKQIESARRAIMGKIKRIGKLWIRIYPDIPITKKALGIRMGKGKGTVESWVARVRKNKIIFELNCSSDDLARKAFNYARTKLPLKTKIVYKK